MKLTVLMVFGLLLFACKSATGEHRLVYVQDGDSAVICCDKGKNFRVRLKDIDAPEKYQPYAKQAKRALKNFIEDKKLKLVGHKKDKYDRWLVDIEVAGLSANKMMIENGHAWLWRFSKSKQLKKLQQKAQREKRGLWALPEKDRVEPYLWRKKNPRNK